MKSKRQKAENFVREAMGKAKLTFEDIWNGLIIPLDLKDDKHINKHIALFTETRSKLASGAGIHNLHDHNPAILVEISDWANHSYLQEISRKFYGLRGVRIPEQWNVLVVEGIDHRTYTENMAMMALVELAIRMARNKGSLKRGS